MTLNTFTKGLKMYSLQDIHIRVYNHAGRLLDQALINDKTLDKYLHTEIEMFFILPHKTGYVDNDVTIEIWLYTEGQ